MRTSILSSFRIRIGKLSREMRAVHCSGVIQAIIEEGERQPTGTPCRQCKEHHVLVIVEEIVEPQAG